MRGRLFRPSREVDEAWQPRLYALLVGLALVVAYVVAFVALNDDEVRLRFVFFTAHVGLIWLILLSVSLGLIAGVLLSQLYRRRGRNGARQAGDSGGDISG